MLGIDTALKVSYSQKSHTTHEPPRSFAEPTKTTTRTVTTVVKNAHQFDVSALVVRDVIPLGDQDANIKVMLHKPEGLAQAKDGEEVAVDLGENAKDVTEDGEHSASVVPASSVPRRMQQGGGAGDDADSTASETEGSVASDSASSPGGRQQQQQQQPLTAAQKKRLQKKARSAAASKR